MTEGNRSIWCWITARPDVSVGHNREWNHLSLDQLLSILEDDIQLPTAELVHAQSSSSSLEPTLDLSLPPVRPRLYVSESKMWNCLTGHGVDYQKVTKFEWLALVGIASVMEEGILQGDLTRLVSQDKRSLPKRTDALARKGYIVKRPILARGCKTSKLWLKPFAPSVQIQKHPTETITEICNADFPRDAIVGDLEPVPWRHHWSGDTIDYATLGRSIMGVVKEFGVIRYQDLRMKLGVAGHPWQMKVVTRTCRFFIELGLLQYVTASMGNRIFRDCIKFKRDITPDDLAIFISGGGSAFKFGNNHEPKKLTTRMPKDNAIQSSPAERWCPEKPLTIAVLETILSSGSGGITNKGLAFNTIGVFFERHISAISTAVSLKDIQPNHLGQLSARKEHCRSGRFAFYKFFPDIPPDHGGLPSERPISTGARTPSAREASARRLHSSESIYGFHSPQCRIPVPNSSAPRSGTSNRKRPLRFALSIGRKKRRVEPASPSLVVSDTCSHTKPVRKRGRPRKDPMAEITPTTKPSTVPHNKHFVCDKCGGSWKNDVGLKYHQRKSRTSCNPAFIATPATNPGYVAHQGHPRKSLGASGRAVESKALINFRIWKGDTSLRARSLSLRKSQAPAPLDDGDTINITSDPHPNRIVLANETTSFIGGIIQGHLSQGQNGPSRLLDGLSSLCVSSKKRQHLNRRPKVPIAHSSSDSVSIHNYNSDLPPGIAMELPTRDTTNALQNAVEVSNVPRSRLLDAALPYIDDRSMPEDGSSMEIPGGLEDDSPQVPEFQPSSPLRDSVLAADARDILRAKEIIKYLLKNNYGAFPSRISLWHALLIVWHKAFAGDNIPTYTISQRAVKDLIKRKEVVENTFAFRDSAGTISDCYLLVESGIDPNLPQFQRLKALMKEAHPRPFIPHEFAHPSAETPSANQNCGPQWGSGRRKHVMSVEVLDAPIYISQAARKRSAPKAVLRTSEAGEIGSMKRVRRAFKVNTSATWPPVTPDWHLTGRYQQLRFLKPNTHLGEEGLSSMPESENVASAGPTHAPSEASHHDSRECDRRTESYISIKFTECTNIQKGTIEWPTPDNDFFEFKGSSFTLIGPTPDREGVTQHMRQRTTYSNLHRAYGSMYGSFLAHEQPDLLFARPVGPNACRATPLRGRLRSRRDRPPQRFRLKERVLMPISKITEGHHQELRTNSIVTDGYALEEALTVAFVAIRALLGGSSKAIDWGLLMRLFPDQSLSDLRRFWVKLMKDRIHFLTSFTEKFQDAFLKSYENGELPPLDYDDLPGYDWQALIQWAVELRRTNFVRLPIKQSSDTAVKGARGFTLEDQPMQHRHWHERFYHHQASIFSRFELSTSESAALSLPSLAKGAPNATAPDAVQVAISWVRALSTTPSEKCPPDIVKSKLATLASTREQVNAILDEAVTSLNTRRIITKRIRSKPYMLSRPFQSNLAKFGHEKKFRAASDFKKLLDETFRRAEPFKIPFLAEDGANMALLNLYAYGRLQISGTNVPKIPLGFKPGNYESRKMPKSHLLFGLVATPSESYLFDDDIAILKLANDIRPPANAPDRLTPFWCDFFGEINITMWTKLLGLVTFMLSVRGSMPFSMLSLQTKAYLEEFDLQLLVSWGKAVGLFAEDPKSGGIEVSEWWWLVVGRQRTWSESETEESQEPPKDKVQRPRGRPRKRLTEIALPT